MDSMALSHIAPHRRTWSAGVNGLLKAQWRYQLEGGICEDQALFSRMQCTLKSMTITWSCSPTGGTHGFRNEGVKVTVALLTITPGNPLGEFVLSFSTILGSADLDVLASKGRKLPPGDTAGSH